MRLRPLLAALIAAASLVAAAAAPANAMVVGIADQKPEMFTDPLFSQLHVKYARLSVSWDAMTRDWQVAELDQWLNAARAAGVQPLIGWDHSRGDDHRVLPTPSRFKYEFRRFRARYPWVTTFATWNEANHCGEPTCHRPKLVAAYYRAMRQECGSCTLLAAEVIDMPNMAWWVRRFQHFLKVKPKLWGLHNYLDVNRLTTSGTKKLIRLTRGHKKGHGRRRVRGSRIWFTETGGIVKRQNRSTITFPESARHAARATRWLFHRLVPLSRRITRVYLYHWNAGIDESWDSGLVSPHGHPRPAFRVVRRQAHAAALRRAKAREARKARRLAAAHR
ncbi:MAG TPA: hypothetical protein VFT50_15780 [Baekduia sp.]|nr:hypothetical protein [Baekduia sp.]